MVSVFTCIIFNVFKKKISLAIFLSLFALKQSIVIFAEAARSLSMQDGIALELKLLFSHIDLQIKKKIVLRDVSPCLKIKSSAVKVIQCKRKKDVWNCDIGSISLHFIAIALKCTHTKIGRDGRVV